jgi:sulfate transport system permease protein
MSHATATWPGDGSDGSARPSRPNSAKRPQRRSVLPGFNLTLGYTVLYLSLIVLIPLSALVFKTLSLTWPEFWEAVTSPRVLASYRLTFGASLIAATVNVVFGMLVAWVLVRYTFPGKKIVDALVDLPFALPTAVAGISLTALLAGNGWIGQYLEPHGIQLAFNPNGVVIALIFIGIPFVVRTVQPVLEDAEKELEEAATCLGATRWQTFSKVIFPSIAPALLTGFAMLVDLMPSFWTALVFLLFFSLFLGLFPASGTVSFEDPVALLKRIALPVFVLSVTQVATMARITRTAVLEVLSEDYVRTARSLGWSEIRVLFRPGLRNAALPIVTVIGLSFGNLLNGTIIVEFIFTIPGLGSILIAGINSRDYQLVQTLIVLYALFFVSVNFLTDLVYKKLDPRVQF